MTRSLRIEYPGAVYHVTARGTGRQNIFLNDSDRTKFLDRLLMTVCRHNWLYHAYCLMSNHYHLLLETPDGNLSVGMKLLNSVYAQYFNHSHDRTGHLFQGRFKAIVVEKDSYLLELCRYIVLNPVRSGIVKSPDDYKWSSYRQTAGLYQREDNLLSTEWILSQFGFDKFTAEREYILFVNDSDDTVSPFEKTRGHLILGGERFAESLVGSDQYSDLLEVPRNQRFLNRPSLKYLFACTSDRFSRNKAIYTAHIKHGYSQQEIAKHSGIHYSTISKIIKNLENNN
ncbi:MAG: helix-turn-helix domain-containing protein [Candidatus Aegiribacteria sp.]|nr:helix-turn-helix domain-containing protein [Candidatus Aegiribacteria sp.]